MKQLRTVSMTSTAVLVILGLFAGLIVAAVASPLASAQSAAQWRTIWGESAQNGDVLPNAKVWKFRQSCIEAPDYPEVVCENPIGSADAAEPSLDDSGWREYTAQLQNFYTGSPVANHYRKTFTLADADIVPAQIEDLRFAVQYDDTAVVYLNGHEIYRSIRGNLDPTYTDYGPKQACFDDPVTSCNVPFDVLIPSGGAEQQFTEIPNYNNENGCGGLGDEPCPDSPYNGTPDPDPVNWQVVLDADGDGTIEADEEQVWGVTVWNRSGSADTTFNHTFQLLMADAPAQRMQINEVQASNGETWGVDLDGDGDNEYPDWIEVHNYSDENINLDGWTLSDGGATFPLDGLFIARGGYLVIAANDCDIAGAANNTPCSFTSPPQANFKISKTGDSLTLTDDRGFVEDETGLIPDQFTDGSYGRVFDEGPLVYLERPTLGGGNNVNQGTDYAPVLRFFPDRIYNVGETVMQQAEAFDPDNDELTWGALSFGGVNLDSSGLVTGTATDAGIYVRPLRVSDNDGTASQFVTWRFLAPPAQTQRLVLNEYNAVAGGSELLAGQGPVGNGGDWFEFLVVEDNLDIRGWTIEIYDRKGSQDQLRNSSSLTFANRPELSALAAGTILVLSEENADDLSFDGNSDWTINLQVTNDANGVFFEAAGDEQVFNSTRSGNAVILRDAAGELVAPLAGETEAWDDANGGVNGQEVMNLCVNPSTAAHIDPVADYRDNASISTQGAPNQCRYTVLQDPADPLSGVDVSFDQNFGDLRATASFGAGDGDVNCDGEFNILDAYSVARFAVGLETDSGPCFGDLSGGRFFAGAGDINNDDQTLINDAYQIARCAVDLDPAICPE